MKLYLQIILAILATASDVLGYHILCYHPIPSKSHDLLARGVIDPLLSAGHKITWVTPFPAGKNKNITIIDVSQTIQILKDLDMTNRKVTGFQTAKSFAKNITKAAFSEDLQEALRENQYDAVISEWFFADVEAGFAAVQKIPWIVLSGIPMHTHMESLVDTVKSIPIVPELGTSYPIPMTFLDRLKTTFTYLLITYDRWVSFFDEAAVYEAFFKPVADARKVTLPAYSEAIRNIAVLLVNSHSSFAPAQSLPPNVVEIGGYHIDEQTPALPKDLKEILDSSTHGVVYFSMGTVLKSAALPQQTKKDLIQVLGSIPYTVLWKYEEELENLPKNIHVRSWMPQSSILAHPNVKLFISHCGHLSFLETLHFGVPMLALPVFADQPSNAAKAAQGGYAVKVTFRPDMKEEFREGLIEILSNESYYKKAKYVSGLFRHRAVAPAALIRHYVELAIESKGAHHLRSISNLYTWYQIWMLDQIAVLLVGFIVVFLILRKITNVLRKNTSQVTKTHKDKKSN